MPYMVSKSDGDDNWSSFGDKTYDFLLYSFLYLNKCCRYLFNYNCSWPLFYSSQFVFTEVLKRTTTELKKRPCQWEEKKVSMKNMKMICIFSPRKSKEAYLQFTSIHLLKFYLKWYHMIKFMIKIWFNIFKHFSD